MKSPRCRTITRWRKRIICRICRAGLFNTNGVWINISIRNALGLVPAHDLTFGGRSTFMVLFHDADGRKAGLDYLKQLHAVEPMFVPSGDTNDPITMNQFPAISDQLAMGIGAAHARD